MCYRALTGDVPDDATDRMRNDPLSPVSERCAGQVSAEFLSAIDWALSVDEGDRPQSVGAWRVALEKEIPGNMDVDPSATTSVTDPPSKVQDRKRDDASPVHHPTKSKGKLFVAFACVIALWACAIYYYHYEYLPDQRRRTEEAVGTDAVRESERRQEQRIGRKFRDCNECPEMVVVPSGSFTMGSLSGEEGRNNDESPRHVVRIDYRFAVGVYEVTFAEWDACVADGGCMRYRPR